MQRKTNGEVNISHENTTVVIWIYDGVTRNDDKISASPRNIGIYMTLFEQNCNNLKMAAISRNM